MDDTSKKMVSFFMLFYKNMENNVMGDSNKERDDVKKNSTFILLGN